MTIKPQISDKFIVIAGGLGLLLFILSGWLPMSCPLLKQAIGGCTTTPLSRPLTEDEEELKRVPHQNITSTVGSFTTKAEDDRSNTAVRFLYKADLSNYTAVLQVKKEKGYEDVSLITSPLLSELKWPSITSDNFRLYQRTPAYTTLDEFIKNPPAASTFALDSVATSTYGLQSSTRPLEDLTSLEGIDYVLTSYSPPVPDGNWLSFDRRFNLQEASVNRNGDLEWVILLDDPGNKRSFLISTVHIDYAQRP